MHVPTPGLLALLLHLTISASAAAEPVRGDVEVDPTAYALSGSSIHVGIGYRNLRVDLGNYGIAIPQLVHGNDAFDVSFDGFGTKLQWFRRDDQLGWFAGVDVGLARMRVQLRGTDVSVVDHQLGTGINAGYRFALPAGFYVTPWIGIGYVWSADDVMLGGERFDTPPVTVFPAIHVGYRFPAL